MAAVFADAFRADRTLSLFAPDAGAAMLHLLKLQKYEGFFTQWQSIPGQQRNGAWWDFDLSGLNGDFEYGFTLDNQPLDPMNAHNLIVDPFAVEIVRYGGYRGVLRLNDGERQTADQAFWDDELSAAHPLAENNTIVMYELPLRWIEGPEEDPIKNLRQVGLGTFDKALFERLDDIVDLGVNAIELLPVADSADTLNWGYGTRFFFAPDLDMGAPIELKLFIKSCHQRGIRVLLDVVMNHARKCPLEKVAADQFFLREQGDYALPEDKEEHKDRAGWGGKLFRYATPYNGVFWSREFQYAMAEYWMKAYHIDGFRIDAVKDIKNWDFLQEFRERAWNVRDNQFQNRPFLVVAEDTNRRAEITQNVAKNPGGKQVVDSMWNFSFRDELRLLLSNRLTTVFGQPSRRDRVNALIKNDAMWDGYGGGTWKPGFTDLSQTVNYITSHDVEQPNERRLMSYFLQGWLQDVNVLNIAPETIERAVDNVAQYHRLALAQLRSAFALMLTSVGIPMFLAGEEFGDIHDLDPLVGALKMGDPVDFARAQLPGHRELREAVKDLIRLRTCHPALQRNEVSFFHFHSTFDDNDGERVFAYCRINAPYGDNVLGQADQVIVIANCGPRSYPEYEIQNWYWQAMPLFERGAAIGAMAPQWIAANNVFRLSLASFQVRVFETGRSIQCP